MGFSKVVRELVTKWAFDADTEEVTAFNAAIDKTKTIAVSAGKAVAAGASLAGGAILALTLRQANLGDESAKTAQRLGLTVEALQEIKAAGAFAGATESDVLIGLRQLAKNTTDFLNGTGEAKVSIDALRISAKQLRDLDLDQRLALFADRFAELEDGPTKTAHAMRIFGESGAALIPLLNGGAKGLEAARAEVRSYGLISTEAAKASEALNDNLLRGRLVLGGMSAQLGTVLIPKLSATVEKILNWRAANRELFDGIVAQGVQLLGDAYDALETSVGGLLETGTELVKWYHENERAQGALRVSTYLLASALAVLAGRFAIAKATAFTASMLGALKTIGAMLVMLRGPGGALNLMIMLTQAMQTFAATTVGSFLIAAAPVLALAAVITGVILLIEDVYAFMRGQPSAIGEIIERTEDLGGAWEYVHRTLKTLFGGRLIEDFSLSMELLADDVDDVTTRIVAYFRSLPGKAQAAMAEQWGSFAGWLARQVASLPGGKLALDLAANFAGSQAQGAGAGGGQLPAGARAPQLLPAPAGPNQVQVIEHQGPTEIHINNPPGATVEEIGAEVDRRIEQKNAERNRKLMSRLAPQGG